MKLGWTNEAPEPDAAGPAQPGGFTGFLSGHRPDPAEGRTLEAVLDRAHRNRDPAEEPRDQDEATANLMARGYQAGQLSQLSARLAETQAELAAEREKIERSRRRQERARRDHAAGRITGFDIMRMDLDEGDQAKADRLERRAGSLRRQLADASVMIAPRQEPADPLEAASRRAHDAFVEATRAKMAAAAAGRPAPRPFGSISRGAAVRGEQPPCEACAAVGASPEESFLIHHTDADGRPISGEAELASGQEAGRGRSGRYAREITRVTGADGSGLLGNQFGDVIAR
jgi:hypothetical protein